MERIEDDGFVTSFGQQRLWYASQIRPESPLYNMAHGLRLHGELNVRALEDGLREVVRRHEVLRTTYEMRGGELIQRVRDWSLRMSLEDLRNCPDKTERLRVVIEREARRVFDLGEDLMLRAHLVVLGDREHLLLLVMHHIASDGWSVNVLYREVRVLYEAYSEGRPSPLEELPIQYVDYAAWERNSGQGVELKSQLGYWMKQLSGVVPSLELPVDRPGVGDRTFEGGTVSFRLERDKVGGLRRVSQENGATLFMTLLALFKVLLFRYSGQGDLIVGTPVARRTEVQTESMIGFFVNLLALRSTVSGDLPFKDFVRQVRGTVLDGLVNQEISFDKVVEALNPQRRLTQNPLFQVMFILQTLVEGPEMRGGVEFVPMTLETGTSRFDLTMSVEERGEELQGSIEYSTELFDRATIERMAEHFCRLAAGAVRDPCARVSRLEMLGAAERSQVVFQWNETAMEFPRHKRVDQLFAEQAKETPEKVAIEWGERKASYGELNQKADAVARQLSKYGVGPESVVGVCLTRSIELIAVLLGIWRVGAAYLPLDPANPKERLKRMVEDADLALMLTEEALERVLPEHECPRLLIGDWVNAIGTEWVDRVFEGKPLAYLLYTSGSTGMPKGVAIEHRSLVNFLFAMKKELGFGRSERVLAITTLSFDIAGLELYLPLVHGGTVVLVDREDAQDGARLRRVIERSDPTLIQATPATWRMLIESGWSRDGNLKMLCGGEAMDLGLAQELGRRGGLVWNVYGPTETTIWSTIWKVKEGERMLIGRPIGNTRAYVLDEEKQPVAIGLAGELYLGGEGVAREYWKRKELTESRFIPDPLGARGAGRLYRTGDWVRWRNDGNLEYLGRLDQQVKIRGYRIELGEIEAVLARHPDVRSVAVISDLDGRGEACLIAYVVSRTGDERLARVLRPFVTEHLPQYMVPSYYVMLPDLPLLPSKKVDRKALPRLKIQMWTDHDDWVGPRDPQQCQLARIWERLFGIQPIGVRQNFFDLGGHSFTAVRLFSEIELVFGRRLPLSTLLKAPTIEGLAEVLKQTGYEARWASLVPMKTEGTKPPLFLFHAVGGNLLNYRELVQHLEVDQPVYGLQVRGLDGTTAPFTAVEEMAGFYLSEMRQVQPKGPYFLAGASFGGLLAYEAAQQLQRQGEQVGLVALIDSVHLHYDFQKAGWSRLGLQIEGLWDRFCFHSGNLWRGPERLAYICERLRIAVGHYQRVWRNRAWELAHEYLKATGRPLPRTLYRVNDANYSAIKRYRPRPYPGRLTLFRSVELSVAHRHDVERAWRGLAALEIYDVPGNHVTSLSEPHVRVLAGKLERCLGNRPESKQVESQALKAA